MNPDTTIHALPSRLLRDSARHGALVILKTISCDHGACRWKPRSTSGNREAKAPPAHAWPELTQKRSRLRREPSREPTMMNGSRPARTTMGQRSHISQASGPTWSHTRGLRHDSVVDGNRV